MPTGFPSFDDRGDGAILLCPGCGGTHTHIEDAFVAGRPREHGDVVTVHIDHKGSVDHHVPVPLGAGGIGRRHTNSIAGWCEECGLRSAVAFKQHKGETYVSIVTQEWLASDSSGQEPTQTNVTGLDQAWIEAELEDDDPPMVIRASSIDGVRVEFDDANVNLEVLIGGTWVLLVRASGRHEVI